MITRQVATIKSLSFAVLCTCAVFISNGIVIKGVFVYPYIVIQLLPLGALLITQSSFLYIVHSMWYSHMQRTNQWITWTKNIALYIWKTWYIYLLRFNDVTEYNENMQHVCIWYSNHCHAKYRKISNISRTKSSNVNVSRLVLQLSLPNPMKPGVKTRINM